MSLRNLLSFLALLLLPLPTAGQSIDFPGRPPGHVLDTGNWLGDARKNRLEAELSRYRTSHDLDVLVILWDRGCPPGVSLEELARRIGETWSREADWVVVLHVPGSLLQPATAFGGRAQDRPEEEETGLALYSALSRAMKERNVRGRVEALALELAEEIVFMKNRSTYEQERIASFFEQQQRSRAESRQSMIFRAVMATVLALVAVGVVALIYLLKRRPNNLYFPETLWRYRLGAAWSGGGPIVVSLPPRVS
ncbi:MAG: hypothetical protein CMO40_01120 [Verrucomicrobiaceae bacterium]|nr:hypothetical protein [Verrucomicrobiaceae bacterium]